ncbi:HD domain-containing phosphohydrolase [Desulfovulcanus sp.]
METNKILVVDDEESLREICQDVLEDEGYEVALAKDGQEALAILVDDQDIDLVVSDLRMPRMNGLELLRAAKEKKLNADFIVMTGFSTIETAVQCMQLGAADYLPKPFNIQHLLVKVEKVLKARKEKKERKRLSNVVRMLNLSSALNNHLKLKPLIEEFVFHIHKNFNPAALALFMLSDRNRLVKTVVKGKLLRDREDLFSFVRHNAQEVLNKGQSRLIDKYTYNRDEIENFSFSLMLVPMISQTQKIGVIALLRESGNDLFTSSDVQLLSIFASHAASSFQNARMYSRLQDLNMDIIRSYARAVEAKDYYTKGHSERVASYALHLGIKAGVLEIELENLYIGGVLHDIGKIGVPDHILNKSGRLTGEEFAVMRRHPVIGREILKQIFFLKDIVSLVYYHHERIDGKGYPEGKKGDEIPFLCKVLSVADVFEALTSDRAYRPALSPEKAEEIMFSMAGTHLDSDLVNLWFALLREKSLETLRRGKK